MPNSNKSDIKICEHAWLTRDFPLTWQFRDKRTPPVTAPKIFTRISMTTRSYRKGVEWLAQSFVNNSVWWVEWFEKLFVVWSVWTQNHVIDLNFYHANEWLTCVTCKPLVTASRIATSISIPNGHNNNIKTCTWLQSMSYESVHIFLLHGSAPLPKHPIIVWRSKFYELTLPITDKSIS